MRGKHIHRFADNPKEKAFSDVWHEKTPTRFTRAIATERSAFVAATLIQWLGSSVGQFFLNDIQDKIDKNPKPEVRTEIFLTAWRQQNDQVTHTLAWLMGDGNRPVDVSPRDHRVAEDVIEWLSTRDGSLFLGKVAKRIEEPRKTTCPK